MGGPGSGRPRKPNALHELAGNPGKRALPEEPKVATRKTVPSPPRPLGREGAREWRRVARLLVDAGIYTDLDRSALFMYCQAWERWRAAERGIREHGAVIVAVRGNQQVPVTSPYAKEAREQQRIAERLLIHLGLTPSSRHRVVAGNLATPADTGQAAEEEWLFGDSA